MSEENCLFCKIAKGEIPSKSVFENDHVLAFKDLHPAAKVHLLFIHKNHTDDICKMVQEGPQQLPQLFSAINEYAEEQGFDQKGFRLVVNTGKEGGQTVFHTHIHFLAGEQMKGL